MSDNKKKTKSDYKNTPREELIREISKAEDAKTEEEKEARKNAYDAYVSQVTPTYSLPLNMLKAFLVGGIICCIGQGITNFCLSRGMDTLTAGKWTSLILVLISVILTGWNIYPTIAKFGGAGALVPITGFANGVAAPAIEFKKEGQGIRKSEVRFFPLADLLFYMVFLQVGLVGLVYWIWKIMQ